MGCDLFYPSESSEKEKAAGLAPDDLESSSVETHTHDRGGFQASCASDLSDLLSNGPDNLTVALDLARRGFAVFPQRDWGDGEGWKPIKDFPAKASTDAAQIARWWAEWPDARVGLLTGERNGITVLDVDVKNDRDGQASLALLGFPDLAAMTPVRSRTPSGGWHLFFAFDPAVKGTVGKIGPGLDVRNRNQFVVAPGSLKDGRRYHVDRQPLGSVTLPPFPAKLVPPPAPEREPATVLATASDDQRQWAAGVLAKKAAELAATAEGARNGTLNGAAMWAGGAAAHGMLTEEQAKAALVPAALQAGVSEREARQWFRHAWKDGLAKPIGDYPQGWEDDFDDLPPRSATDLSDLLGNGGSSPALPARHDRIAIIRAKNGDLKATLSNAVLVLQKVDGDKGFAIRRNAMTQGEEWRGGPITDNDLSLFRVAIEQAGMHNVGELTARAVATVAERNTFHPVRDWLSSLNHDGTLRIDTWLSRYLGTEESPYTRAIGRAFLVAMVARVMRPGCKHDHVLVLSGAQGIGKSTACQILGGPWFGDNMPSIREGAKEAGLFLRGHWLVELAELAPSRKSEAEDLKAFLSRDADEIRAPYARRADVVPRQCVFVGTTNDDAFLRDTTGGRRFWPVTCGDTIDLNGLAADRAQLFAEALAAFHAGEPWHLAPEMETLARGEQEAAREEDPWEAAIRDQVDGEDELNSPLQEVTARDLLTRIGVGTAAQTQANLQRVGRILKHMGWQRKHSRHGKAWVRR